MRLLKTLVVLMGVVLVVGFGVVIFVVVDRMADRADTPSTAAAPLAPVPPLSGLPGASATTPSAAGGPTQAVAFGERKLPLPTGASVADFSASGDRLVLRIVLADQSQRLLVVDLASGAVLGTLLLE